MSRPQARKLEWADQAPLLTLSGKAGRECTGNINPVSEESRGDCRLSFDGHTAPCFT
ncbi:hypothetical protein GCM10009803_19410 [Microbacterium ginsengiterrae]